MNPEKYDETEVVKLFDSALGRAGRDLPERTTINDVMNMAYGEFGVAQRLNQKLVEQINNGTYRPPSPETLEALFGSGLAGVAGSGTSALNVPTASLIDLSQYRPDTALTSMPPRNFVGPPVGKAKLFPTNAVSLFTALGGTGKTSTLISMGAYIAAGKSWGFTPLSEARVLMYFVEEDQCELNRKFGAVTHDWSAEDRERAADNLRLVSLMGRDPHLTARMKQGVVQTPLVAEFALATKEFGAKLLVLDHLQGFADGDLNLSDTATALGIAASQIVALTEAAVVFTAHVNKSNINADEVEAGFTSGSLAFENTARQVTGAIKLPASDGKRMGIDDRADYIKIVMPKNSYGRPRESAYLKKEYAPDFHTIRVVPHIDVAGAFASLMPKGERLKEKIHEYVVDHPGTTKNKLDGLSGKEGRLKASKADVRRALEELIDDGVIDIRPLTADEKKAFGVSQQAKEGLFALD